MDEQEQEHIVDVYAERDRSLVRDAVERFETRFPRVSVDPEALALAVARTGGGRNPFLD